MNNDNDNEDNEETAQPPSRRAVHRKFYLGDSVYAQWNDLGQVVLTTEQGEGATNTIYLEIEVIEAFLAWMELPG